MLIAVRNPDRIAPFGLAFSAFARHYLRNLGWFLFLALLRCFSSGGSPHIPIYSVYNDWTWLQPDCSIRISADHFVLANPRSFSQLTASFFGSWCQGILPALLLAWPFRFCESNYELLRNSFWFGIKWFGIMLVSLWEILFCSIFTTLFYLR